ncbi:Peptidase T [Polystyrenella longa]|uniref:Peptidase T n=1 Tax=Polystyrenella longa TaxID=2528007 RepID=A0A518CN04_9PLAN|nr:peptidase T [Polystyrenella longa]QDU80584.1 Peptidase T [Polystyrenella longa]
MTSLLDRFLVYVKIDTKADAHSDEYPSTRKQLTLCRLLKEECEAVGLSDVHMNEYGIVTGTIPATPGCTAPAIAFFAHVDTSPEFTGENVQPQVRTNYDGKDVVLKEGRILKVADFPELADKQGETIITTDGTTLLGGDDKSGIAIIMTAAAKLINSQEFPHGPVKVCFTCDEEIGHGTDHIDLDTLDCICGYTLDGDGAGKIDTETFSADMAVVRVSGINIHPSIGKGKMVNAIRYLSEFIGQLPMGTDAPEVTTDRQGFMHPYEISGTVAQASVEIILRDFETKQLKKYANQLQKIAKGLIEKEPRLQIEIDIIEQYRNMREGLKKEPRALEKAVAATEAAGLKPVLSIIRGGTDGSVLTEKGLPTPNLSSGQHNPHSPLEWASLEEMEQAVEVVLQLAKRWGEETA